MRDQFGMVSFSGKEIAIPAIKFDRMACSGRGEILFLSCFTEAMRVKAVRAVLSGGVKGVTSDTSGANLFQEGRYSSLGGRMYASAEGYAVYTQKLGYGLMHAMFFTRAPGFLKTVTHESLWQELKSERFTTPLLREWIPWIEAELRSDDMLENAYCHGCKCGVLTAGTTQLDNIVKKGIKAGELWVRESKP